MTRALRIIPTTRIAAALLAVALAAGCGDSPNDPVNPNRPTKTVAISGAVGSGRVTSSNSKIDCRVVNGATNGPTCSAAFDSGSVATLTATADTDQEFVAWSGDCAGTTCQLSVTRDATVSPRFAALQATLSLMLTTPNADDGAILFTVSGPSVLGVTPAAGVELVESRATAGGSTTSTILVRGALANGAIGTLAVRGVNADSPYTVQVREAAARASGNYAQRADLAQYRVTVQK